MTNLCNILQNIIQDNRDSVVWIAGDMNLPNVNWDLQCLNGNNYPALLCNIFLDLLNNHGMTQIVNFPTRASNILDIFSTKRPSLILQCKPLAGLSNHKIVFVESSLEALHQQSPKKTYKLWSRADTNRIQSHISEFTDLFKTYDLGTPVDTLWSLFYDMCHKCLSMIPTKTYTNKHCPPWITNKI